MLSILLPSSNVTVLKDVFFENADSPILVTLDGILILVKDILIFLFHSHYNQQLN